MTEIDDLIKLAEDLFCCITGSPTPSFDLPQQHAGPIKVVYITYAIIGPSPAAVASWMADQVLRPLEMLGGKFLYWRILPGRFEISQQDNLFRINTRIAVLDDDLKQIKLSDLAKPHGDPTPTIGAKKTSASEIDELRDRIQFLETLAGFTTNTARSPVCENLKWYQAHVPQLGKKNDGSLFFRPIEEDYSPRASEFL